MGQPRTVNWGEGDGLGQALRCGCWDCAAHRRYLLRKVALVAVLVGLSCGWAIESGARQGVVAGGVATVADAAGWPWI
jgi:hypothetical protein